MAPGDYPVDFSNTTWWRLPSSGLVYYRTGDLSFAAEVADVVKNVALDLAVRLAFREPAEPTNTSEAEVDIAGRYYLIPTPAARSIALDWNALCLAARDNGIPCRGTFVQLGRDYPSPRGTLPSEDLPWLEMRGLSNGLAVLATPDGHYWKDCRVRRIPRAGPRRAHPGAERHGRQGERLS
jgi:hypothetical protein